MPSALWALLGRTRGTLQTSGLGEKPGSEGAGGIPGPVLELLC